MDICQSKGESEYIRVVWYIFHLYNTDQIGMEKNSADLIN